jgi:hypothetical protein
LAAPEPQFRRSSAAVCPRSPSLKWVYKEPSVDPFFFFSSSHDNLPNLHNAFHKQQPSKFPQRFAQTTTFTTISNATKLFEKQADRESDEGEREEEGLQ